MEDSEVRLLITTWSDHVETRIQSSARDNPEILGKYVNDTYRSYGTKIPNRNFRNFFINGKQPPLLHLTETKKTALDNGLKVGVLFIDFRKAFDTVNHTILLEKLKATGISGDLLSWLTDYMSMRQQFAQISGN